MIRAIPLLLLLAAPAYAADLGEVYGRSEPLTKGTLSHAWVAHPEDVWKVSKFRWSRRKDGRTILDVSTGPAVVVIGRNGDTALWAAVLPEKPGTLVTDEGLPATDIWLRFPPGEIGRIFPKETVEGRGPAKALVPAMRLCQYRMRNSLQADDLPMVPGAGFFVVDADTGEDRRRMYFFDPRTGMKLYKVPRMGPPPRAPITKADSLKAFDTAWAAFDREYAMFGVKPGVDWGALRDLYRPIAAEAKTAYETAGAINLLTRRLRDLHVHVKHGNQLLPLFRRPRPLNMNGRAMQKLVGPIVDSGKGVAWGRTRDGIGYIGVWHLSGDGVPDAFDEALEQMAGTWALVIDIRPNGGGNETLAQKMTARLVDAKRAYSQARWRSGPKHDDLGESFPRHISPRGPWRYESPVAALIGQRVMSSAESFAKMLGVCPQVTVMGDRTAGSSGNPRQLTLPGGITVNVPQWLDLDMEGNPLDGRGVRPDVPVPAPLDALRKGDPVLEAALGRLRKIPKEERKPGKR